MGVRVNADLGKAVLALKRCVVATFDYPEWQELGYLTKSDELIARHPRLLRSLHFGDEDYDGNALEVMTHTISS